MPVIGVADRQGPFLLGRRERQLNRPGPTQAAPEGAFRGGEPDGVDAVVTVHMQVAGAQVAAQLPGQGGRFPNGAAQGLGPEGGAVEGI